LQVAERLLQALHGVFDNMTLRGKVDPHEGFAASAKGRAG